jgi:hypothetical protein
LPGRKRQCTATNVRTVAVARCLPRRYLRSGC